MRFIKNILSNKDLDIKEKFLFLTFWIKMQMCKIARKNSSSISEDLSLHINSFFGNRNKINFTALSKEIGTLSEFYQIDEPGNRTFVYKVYLLINNFYKNPTWLFKKIIWIAIIFVMIILFDLVVKYVFMQTSDDTTYLFKTVKLIQSAIAPIDNPDMTYDISQMDMSYRFVLLFITSVGLVSLVDVFLVMLSKESRKIGVFRSLLSLTVMFFSVYIALNFESLFIVGSFFTRFDFYLPNERMIIEVNGKIKNDIRVIADNEIDFIKIRTSEQWNPLYSSHESILSGEYSDDKNDLIFTMDYSRNNFFVVETPQKNFSYISMVKKYATEQKARVFLEKVNLVIDEGIIDHIEEIITDDDSIFYSKYNAIKCVEENHSYLLNSDQTELCSSGKVYEGLRRINVGDTFSNVYVSASLPKGRLIFE